MAFAGKPPDDSELIAKYDVDLATLPASIDPAELVEESDGAMPSISTSPDSGSTSRSPCTPARAWTRGAGCSPRSVSSRSPGITSAWPIR